MFLGLSVSLLLQGIISGLAEKTFLDRLIILLGEIAILVPPVIILKQRKLKLPDLLPLRPVSPVTILMAIILVSGAIGMVTIYEILMLPYFPMPSFLKDLELELSQGDLIDMLVLIFAGSLVAPLVEEFLFRGILQQSLFYKYGSLLPALVVPTVIFVLFHVAYLFYVPALFELIGLALLLGWVMAKTGNIIIPILVHGLFNLSSFGNLFFPQLEDVATLAELGWSWMVFSTLFILTGWLYFKAMPLTVFENVYLISGLSDKEA